MRDGNGGRHRQDVGASGNSIEGRRQEMLSWHADHWNTVRPLRAQGSGRRASWPPVLRGSMTVEAALVLPLFIYFFCNILGMLDIIRLQCAVFAAVRETGTKLCEYAYYLENTNANLEDAGIEAPSMSGGVSSLILSETYVRSDVQSYLGASYMEQSPLLGDSISFLQSSILNGDDLIQIVADYRVEPFVPIIAPASFGLQTRFVSHAWNGYEIVDVHDGKEEEDTEDPEVYITPSGSVYHTDADCTYLRPHVRQASGADIGDMRSSDGSCYYACESCHPTRLGTVYYTPDGNRYHASADCNKIKRTIVTVHLSEVQGSRRACSKCAGG